MRQLLPGAPGSLAGVPTELDDDLLEAAYSFPDEPTLRVNFVSTLDGAATGPSGLTGSINNTADGRVFGLQRRLCDVILVGAETARLEGYRRVEGAPDQVPILVVVTTSAKLPPTIVEPVEGRGDAVLVTSESASPQAVARAREALGPESVWVVGAAEVDLAGTVERLVASGRRRILCEGGPTLFAALLAHGLVDEMALTWVPTVLTGSHPRITSALADLDTRWEPTSLIEEAGTVLGLWSRRA